MKSMMTRIIAFLLSAALVLSVFPYAHSDVHAADTDSDSSLDTLYLTYINPLYEDVITEEELNALPSQSDVGSSSKARTLLASPSYSSVESAGTYMRGEMTERTEDITFDYVYETDTDPVNDIDEFNGELKELLHEIFAEAVRHTGEPTEGDYLKWQYGGWTASIEIDGENGAYCLTVTYALTYYTTAAEEAEVDDAVEVLLDELGLDSGNSLSDYTVVKTIYDYICENVTYDYDNLYDSTYLLKHTAYAALINGTAVCQGYALLFYRLTLECGIDARIVPNSNHGWNIVEITDDGDDYYYYADSTWDAGTSTYSYFLKGSADFTGHIFTTATTDITDSYDIPEHRTYVTVAGVSATCEADGLTEERYCVDCEMIVQSQEVIPATGHSYDSGKVVNEATYTEKGQMEYTCSVCGETITEDVDYLEGLSYEDESALAYYKDGEVNTDYNDFALYEDDGNWYYVQDGYVSTSANSVINGTVNGTKAWWYVVGGVAQTSFTGLADYSNQNGWWYIEDGKVTFTANTVAKNKNGWYYVKNSKVYFTYTGFAENSNGWWYIENGKVTFEKNSVIKGTVNGTSAWWYVVGSKVQTAYTGLANYSNANGWWYIRNGKVDFTVNTVAKNKNGWWYVTGGKVQFGYTGLADYSNANGWWYIKNGKVNFSFQGIAMNKNGWWYLSGGKVQFGYTGTVKYNGKIYQVTKGKVAV